MSPVYEKTKNNRCLNILIGLCILTALPAEFIKEKIQALNTQLEKKQDPDLFFELACSHLADQELEAAYTAFLNALEKAPKKETLTMSEIEENLYNQAIALYFKENSSFPEETAKKLINQFGLNFDQNHEHLRLLLATAYANVGQFSHFFEHFYSVYPRLHDHFLTYKTLAVINFRLMQCCPSLEKRIFYKEKGIALLHKSLEKNSKDPSVYKKLVILAKEKADEQLLLSYLEKMVNCEAWIARGDILFYVHEALTLRRKDIAQKMLENAKKEFGYSRAIIEAEAMVTTYEDT